jgi:hypothetical protein
MYYARKLRLIAMIVGFALSASAVVKADGVTDWNKRACDILAPGSFDPPPANRALALMHTAIYEAVNAITRKYPARDIKIDAPAGASIQAAISAAARTVLLKVAPAKKDDIEAAYRAALASVPDDGSGKANGIAVGEEAAAAVLAARFEDGYAAVESYRPYTIAGVYVPTTPPAVTIWPGRKPWLMTSAAQFRPGPPPDLKSELWARDYNEIKAVGRKTASKRTDAQTATAKFWEANGVAIYHTLVSSVTTLPGREVTENARLLMAVTQAVDDAMIAVFDAKYHYNFWRPVTAIRNGDIDGNDATERDPSWTPFINTPMHPEYPCAHCIVAATVGTILEAEIGKGKFPDLATTSYTADNARRTWASIEDFIQEVSNGRIYDGVHFRTSTEVATAMGRKIGKLAAEKYLKDR